MMLKYAVVFICGILFAISLMGCSKSVGEDARYKASVLVNRSAANGFIGNRLDEVRRGKKTLAWLAKIEKSGKIPVTLIDVTVFPDQKVITIDWGANSAQADGVLIALDGGKKKNILFWEGINIANMKSQKEYIFFDSIIYAKDLSSELWSEFLSGDVRSVQLSSLGEPISNNINVYIKRN